MGPPSSAVESASARSLPFELGRYVLLRELGSGGMATVYLSKMRLAEGLERLVAVKTIHDELSGDSTFVDMFLDEAKIASLISHPNVCSVHDFGHSAGTYYMAMEYLAGEPVSAIVRELWEHKDEPDVMAALPYVAARIVADVCEGLHAAHETRGQDGQRLDVVHRDVSPQNLFVTYEGAVKVVDFGCAKAHQRITETSAGIFKGKVAYAAPEQLKIEKLDARTDVWAAGACLWELLTLERLFKRETPMKTARAILAEPIERVDSMRSFVPRELADIVARALTREPDGRYATARDMGRALRTFIAGSGTTFEGAELAEWISFLFDERRSEVLGMLEAVEASLASRITTAAQLDVASPPSHDVMTAPRVEPPRPASYAAVAPPAPLVEFDDDETIKRDSKRPEGIRAPQIAMPPAPPTGAAGPSAAEMSPSYRRLRLLREDAHGPARKASRKRHPLWWAIIVSVAILIAGGTIAAALIFTSGDTRTPAAATGEGVGSVHLRARTGWAEVSEHERVLGRTPLDLELSAGPHVLEVRGYGRGPASEVTVHVQPGVVQRVIVRAR